MKDSRGQCLEVFDSEAAAWDVCTKIAKQLKDLQLTHQYRVYVAPVRRYARKGPYAVWRKSHI